MTALVTVGRAKDAVVARGGVVRVALDGLEAPDLRSQEELAVRRRERVAAELATLDPDEDVTVVVQFGETAGCLLVVLEVLRELSSDRAVGAVVIRPAGSATWHEPELADADILCRAMCGYAMDRRLTWAAVTDERLTGLSLGGTQKRAFGSRLYGE